MKTQTECGREDFKFVYNALKPASSPTHSSLRNPSVVYQPAVFFQTFSGVPNIPGMLNARGETKMAVTPYVSRAELWLANSSFRPVFRLPNDFHPSIFLKWFPGHMAKGVLAANVEFLLQNCLVQITHLEKKKE